MPRIFTERSEVPLVTLNVCNEAVQSRGRGPAIHSLYFGKYRFVCLPVCPHPLYTRPPHPFFLVKADLSVSVSLMCQITASLIYQTIPYHTKKIPYHIPDDYHTKNYRTAYQKNTVPHTRRYRNPAIPYRTKNTVPHTRPYHTIPIPCLTIPYRYPAIPHRTLPVGAPTHNSAKSTGHSTQVRSSTSLLLLRKREASAVEPVAGVSDVGRRMRKRWTLFLWLIDFRTQRHRIEPGGGRRVRRGGAAKE